MRSFAVLSTLLVMFILASGHALADAPVAGQAGSSRMDLDVSPLMYQLATPDPLPELGIHSGRNWPPKGVPREEKLRSAARWLKTAAGPSPLLIELPDTGYTVHLTGDTQMLQQLKDAVEKIVPDDQPQVMFECRLFTMSTEAMAKLDDGLRKKLLSTMVPGSVKGESVTADERTALQKAATTTITAPRLMMFDGHSGYAVVTTERAYVANVTKVLPKPPATQPSYQPDINIVDSGIAVGAKVDVKPQDKTVAVQVKTRMSRLLEMKTSLADPADKQTSIQVPTVEMINFDQLCTVGSGDSLLCHGEREIINGPTTQPVGDDVFFIITATIVQPQPKK